ncbi:MAG: phosphate signaling complex protein PhoU [Promethearchaeota archaeon]
MSKAMRERMEEIKSYMHKMSQLALEAISQGVTSFVELDQKLASRVIKDDAKQDELDDIVEKACVRCIALHQPVASDVRKLIVYIKAINDLRRIGRYGYNIALLTKRMKGLKHFKRLIKIPEMSRLTISMTQTAIHALLSEDAKTLKMLKEDDETVDDMMEELFREVITYTLEDPRRITVAMNYILAGRYLERAEDHALAIGYNTRYLVTGRRTISKRHEEKRIR